VLELSSIRALPGHGSLPMFDISSLFWSFMWGMDLCSRVILCPRTRAVHGAWIFAHL